MKKYVTISERLPLIIKLSVKTLYSYGYAQHTCSLDRKRDLHIFSCVQSICSCNCDDKGGIVE